MKMTNAREFETERKLALARLGRISSSTAHGFIIDLQLALDRAGLTHSTIKWRGGEDGLFTATGRFDGESSEWATKALAALDYELYDDGVATVELSPAAVHISAATWAPELGLATVLIDAEPVTPADIPRH